MPDHPISASMVDIDPEFASQWGIEPEDAFTMLVVRARQNAPLARCNLFRAVEQSQGDAGPRFTRRSWQLFRAFDRAVAIVRCGSGDPGKSVIKWLIESLAQFLHSITQGIPGTVGRARAGYAGACINAIRIAQSLYLRRRLGFRGSR